MTADGWVNLVAIVVSLICGGWFVGHKLGSIDAKLETVVADQQHQRGEIKKLDERVGTLEARPV